MKNLWLTHSWRNQATYDTRFANHSNLRCRRSSDCRGCSRTYTMFRESTTKITRTSLRYSSAGYLWTPFRFHLWHTLVIRSYDIARYIDMLTWIYIYISYMHESRRSIQDQCYWYMLSVREICWLAPRTHSLNTLPLKLIKFLKLEPLEGTPQLLQSGAKCARLSTGMCSTVHKTNLGRW